MWPLWWWRRVGILWLRGWMPYRTAHLWSDEVILEFVERRGMCKVWCSRGRRRWLFEGEVWWWRFPNHVAGCGFRVFRVAAGIKFTLNVIKMFLVDKLIDRGALGEEALGLHEFLELALVIGGELTPVLLQECGGFPARLLAAGSGCSRMSGCSTMIAFVPPILWARAAVCPRVEVEVQQH